MSKVQGFQSLSEAVRLEAKLGYLFNRKSRSRLAHIVSSSHEVDSLCLSPEKYFLEFSETAHREFNVGWPSPKKPDAPQKPLEDPKNKPIEWIAYEQELKEYNRALRIRNNPQVAQYFLKQLLLAWPRDKCQDSASGLEENISPITPDEYAKCVNALKWYLTDKSSSRTLVPQLKDIEAQGLTLNDIKQAYDNFFPGEVKNGHLQDCDETYLDQPIPKNLPPELRHPDIKNVTKHADIITTGICSDGQGWKLRRLNTWYAGFAYGNPMGLKNGSALCFTRHFNKENYFEKHSHDLLLLSSNDGEKRVFIDVQNNMFRNRYNHPVSFDGVVSNFPGVSVAIGNLVATKMSYFLKTGNYVDFKDLLENVSNLYNFSPDITKGVLEKIDDYLSFLLAPISKVEDASFMESKNLSYKLFEQILSKLLFYPPYEVKVIESIQKYLPAFMNSLTDSGMHIEHNKLLDKFKIVECLGNTLSPQITYAFDAHLSRGDMHSLIELLKKIKYEDKWRLAIVPKMNKVSDYFINHNDRKSWEAFRIFATNILSAEASGKPRHLTNALLTDIPKLALAPIQRNEPTTEAIDEYVANMNLIKAVPDWLFASTPSMPYALQLAACMGEATRIDRILGFIDKQDEYQTNLRRVSKISRFRPS